MSVLDREHVNGMLRGAVGSLAGVVAMGLFFQATRKLAGGSGRPNGVDADGEGKGPIERMDALDDISVVGRTAREDENATEAVGRVAYETVAGHDPDEATRQKLGQAVHWGYGVLLGGLYGALRPGARPPDLKGGLGYGTAAWVFGDEVMVPMLGLSAGPTAHPWEVHATALGAHLVYGAVTAATTQALRHVM